MTANNEKLLKLIYEKHFRELVLYSLVYTHRSDVAEDIVEDVIINIFEKDRISAIKGSLLSYLKGAVIKASIKYIRDNKLAFEDLELAKSEEVLLMIDENEEDVIIAKLMKSLSQLPKRSKEILHLILFEGEKHKQVAQKLSISVNSVKSQYYSSLSKIKEMADKTYLFFL